MNSITKRRAKLTEGLTRPGDIHHIIKANFKKILDKGNNQTQDNDDKSNVLRALYKNDFGM